MKYADCSVDIWWCGFISSEVLGALTWFGFIITFIGVLVAIRHAEKAKTAAVSAKTAVLSMKNRMDTVGNAYVNAQLSTLEQVLNDGKFELSLVFFSPMKRHIRKQMKTLSLDEDENIKINRAIDTIRHQIEAGCENKEVKKRSLSNAIDTLTIVLSGWEVDNENSALKEYTDE